MVSDIASSIIGIIAMLLLAYLYARQQARKGSNWYRGNSWGGRSVAAVAPVSAPRTVDEMLDINLRAGRLVWGWR